MAATLLACGSEDTNGNGDDPEPDTLVGAPGVTINQVAIYQGIKRTLMLDGVPQDSNVPLIHGRDAMVRIFYTTDPGYDGTDVTGRLWIGQNDPLEVTGLLGAGSIDGDLGSTMNIAVPGAMVGGPFDYSVALMQDGKTREDNPLAHHPQGGATEPVPVDGPQNTLRLILAPFAYHADGSGRLPNTSPEQVEVFRQRFLALYPISNVEITVRQPTDWYGVISPDGSDWMDIGIELYTFRNADGAPDDVYYYGIFNPAASFMAYCGGGCVLGQTLVNESPPDTGSVAMRLALGVGFDAIAVDTAVHEVGHSHGLYHAPCAPGGGITGVDGAYPYPNGVIGVWGLDAPAGALHAPDVATDFMGYCEYQWVSDYHYNKLLFRSRNVNLPDWLPPPSGSLRYQLIALDGAGRATLQIETEQRRPLSGRDVETTVRFADGTVKTLEGEFFPYDHVPGGWLFVPLGDGSLAEAEFDLGGRHFVARR